MEDSSAKPFQVDWLQNFPGYLIDFLSFELLLILVTEFFITKLW